VPELTFFSARAIRRSSTVLSVMKRYTFTGRVCTRTHTENKTITKEWENGAARSELDAITSKIGAALSRARTAD